MTIQWSKPTSEQLQGHAGVIIGYKFLQLDGSTTYLEHGAEPIKTFYPLPALPNRWGPWLVHDEPVQAAAEDCGGGTYHLKYRPGDLIWTPDYAQPYIAQGMGVVNPQTMELGVIRVKAVRLMRVAPKTWGRLLMTKPNGNGSILRLGYFQRQAHWDLSNITARVELSGNNILTDINLSDSVACIKGGDTSTFIESNFTGATVEWWAHRIWLINCNTHKANMYNRATYMRCINSPFFCSYLTGLHWYDATLELHDCMLENFFAMRSKIQFYANATLRQAKFRECTLVVPDHWHTHGKVVESVEVQDCKFLLADGTPILSPFLNSRTEA